MTAIATEVAETDTLTIELTAEEASALRAVLRKVGGAPNGPRGLIDKILTALEHAGARPIVGWGLASTVDGQPHVNVGVYFVKGEEPW